MYIYNMQIIFMPLCIFFSIWIILCPMVIYVYIYCIYVMDSRRQWTRFITVCNHGLGMGLDRLLVFCFYIFLFRQNTSTILRLVWALRHSKSWESWVGSNYSDFITWKMQPPAYTRLWEKTAYIRKTIIFLTTKEVRFSTCCITIWQNSLFDKSPPFFAWPTII